MFKEIDLGGIFVAPFFGCLIVALVLFIPLSWYFDRWEVQEWFANRPVFDASVFALLLGLVLFVFQTV
jgi:hypothetical protein